jgi:hypothetical protein
MQRSTICLGFGALLLATLLGFPGLAAAEPAGPSRLLSAAEELVQDLPGWDLVVGIFLADEADSSANPGPTGSTSGGGGMDPNGGPKPGASPDPHHP